MKIRKKRKRKLVVGSISRGGSRYGIESSMSEQCRELPRKEFLKYLVAKYPEVVKLNREGVAVERRYETYLKSLVVFKVKSIKKKPMIVKSIRRKTGGRYGSSRPSVKKRKKKTLRVRKVK